MSGYIGCPAKGQLYCLGSSALYHESKYKKKANYEHDIGAERIPLAT